MNNILGIIFLVSIFALIGFMSMCDNQNYSDSYSGRSYISEPDSGGRVIITLPSGEKIRGRYVNQHDSDDVRTLDEFIQGN